MLRVLPIVALAMSLVGCTNGSTTPGPNAHQTNSQMPVAHTTNAHPINMQIRSSAHFRKKSKVVVKRRRHILAREPSAHLKRNADTVTKKAKAAIVAIMEDPASAQFGKVKRAVKTRLGERLDTICGYVKGKDASGKDVGEMPFLYIVHQHEAYLVDGNSPAADTVYRAVCE